MPQHPVSGLPLQASPALWSAAARIIKVAAERSNREGDAILPRVVSFLDDLVERDRTAILNAIDQGTLAAGDAEALLEIAGGSSSNGAATELTRGLKITDLDIRVYGVRSPPRSRTRSAPQNLAKNQ